MTLHYTTLNYARLHYTTLNHTTLSYTTLHYTALRYLQQQQQQLLLLLLLLLLLHLHYTTPMSLHHTTLQYTTPIHYTPLHYTQSHYTTLHYNTLRYSTLHYTTLSTTTTTTVASLSPDLMESCCLEANTTSLTPMCTRWLGCWRTCWSRSCLGQGQACRDRPTVLQSHRTYSWLDGWTCPFGLQLPPSLAQFSNVPMPLQDILKAGIRTRPASVLAQLGDLCKAFAFVTIYETGCKKKGCPQMSMCVGVLLAVCPRVFSCLGAAKEKDEAWAWVERGRRAADYVVMG